MPEATKTIAVRVSRSIEEQIVQLAKVKGQSKSDWLRDQLMQAIHAAAEIPAAATSAAPPNSELKNGTAVIPSADTALCITSAVPEEFPMFEAFETDPMLRKRLYSAAARVVEQVNIKREASKVYRATWMVYYKLNLDDLCEELVKLLSEFLPSTKGLFNAFDSVDSGR